MTERIFNFSAGPATLPTPVLQRVQAELLDYQGSGMSLMEMSHRSKYFDEVLERAEERVRRLMKLGSNYSVIFLYGGASHQFAMVPLNFTQAEDRVDLVHTGHWTLKAKSEIEKLARCQVIASGEDSEFSELPQVDSKWIHEDSRYLHYCSNNTIYGTQWKEFKKRKGIPTVVDMSSDLLSRDMDFTQFDLIYAGAQKNIGPAGLSLILIRNDFAETGRKDIPSIFQYRTHIEHGSRYHTPPCFSIYVTGLVLEWLEESGGLKEIEKLNKKKASLLYECIDESSLYRCPVEKNSRSLMNVVFRLGQKDEALEKRFVQEALAAGMNGLKAHRQTGGIRASLYNAMSLKGVEHLVSFMKEFERKA